MDIITLIMKKSMRSTCSSELHPIPYDSKPAVSMAAPPRARSWHVSYQQNDATVFAANRTCLSNSYATTARRHRQNWANCQTEKPPCSASSSAWRTTWCFHYSSKHRSKAGWLKSIFPMECFIIASQCCQMAIVDILKYSRVLYPLTVQ